MLLAEFAAGAPSAGIELSVGFLEDRDGSPAAGRLRERGVEPVLAAIKGPMPLLNRSDHQTVRRHLAEVRPDVVHTHLGYADMLGGLAARSLGIPAISTIHIMEWQRDLRDTRNYAKERLMSLVRRRYIKTVVAVSDAARRAYLDTGWDTETRVVTVHNGIVAEPRPGGGPSRARGAWACARRYGCGDADGAAPGKGPRRRHRSRRLAARALPEAEAGDRR